MIKSKASELEFDALFGPAYKGMTLVVFVSIACSQLHGTNAPCVYIRKKKSNIT